MATANIYDLADTWNDAGTTFTAIKMTVTQSAAASGSLLLDLKHGTSGSEASKFKVDKDGNLTIGSSQVVTLDGAGVSILNSRNLTFIGTAAGLVSWGDLYLSRKGTANLRLGAADAAGPVAQTLSVQSVVAGTTNTAGADFTIRGSASTGSAVGGNIIFQTTPAGAPPTTQNSYVNALVIDTYNSVFGQNFAQLGGRVSAAEFMTVSGSNRVTTLSSAGLALSDGKYISFSGAPNSLTSQDVFLYRDAANTLALRNGANAQTFNIYNTFTDASNYERGFIRYSSNVLQIGHEGLGSGNTGRTIAFRTAGFNPLEVNSATATFNVALNSGGAISATSTGSTGFFQLVESTGVSAGGATSARIFAQDNGSGKTQLMVQFGSGAAQQIAIEP